jgi:hypothetical protein
MNYARRSSARYKVVKGHRNAGPFGGSGRTRRRNDKKQIRDREMEMRGFRQRREGARHGTTYGTIDPAEPNGPAFRNREFFTRIIRLRQDPSIRYGDGRILFRSRREHKTPRWISDATTHAGMPGLPGSPYEIIGSVCASRASGYVCVFGYLAGDEGQS